MSAATSVCQQFEAIFAEIFVVRFPRRRRRAVEQRRGPTRGRARTHGLITKHNNYDAEAGGPWLRREGLHAGSTRRVLEPAG